MDQVGQGAMVSDRPVAIAPSQVLLAQQGNLLTLADLPTGFQDVPEPLQSLLVGAVSSVVKDYFKGENVTVKDFFAGMDLSNFTLVMAFTTPLTQPKYVQQFDAGLRQPNALKEFTAGVQKSSYYLGSMTIKEQKVLSPLPKGLGHRATGMAIVADAGRVPFFTDSVTFRRNNLGAVVVVGSLYRKHSSVRVIDIAQKLDQRLQSQVGNLLHPAGIHPARADQSSLRE